MNAPIIDPSTLTYAQKVCIREYYCYYKKMTSANRESQRIASTAKVAMLEALFGKEFFTKGK